MVYHHRYSVDCNLRSKRFTDIYRQLQENIFAPSPPLRAKKYPLRESKEKRIGVVHASSGCKPTQQSMKKLLNIQRFKLYLWIALAATLIRMAITLSESSEVFFAETINHIWLIIYIMVLHYILFEFTIPFITAGWKRIFAAPFLLIGHLIFYTIGIYAWRLIGISLHIYTELQKFDEIEEALKDLTGYSVGSLFFFGIVRHIYHYRKLKISTQQLRIEKQEAELNYLKSQTNPHFLFNTLNNIYSLARDKNDLAPESILRLSKILRYMLYETGGGSIAIEQELKIIDDYIALEKLRYDDSLRINFNYDIEEMKQALPPLLLIPLVENAFKHGVSETRNQPFVDIHLSVRQRQLRFVVKNSAEKITNETGVKENIGLSNLRRQLELLYTNYNLSFNQSNSVFTATLQINLASNVSN
jgi:two-component system, LytTR family, sensor kinase